MADLVGVVAAVYRYPIKSMAGESITNTELGWHGLSGDRRLAIRRLDDQGGFPWLTASRVPSLILHVPERLDGTPDDALPSHVRTPDGARLPLFSDALAAHLGALHGAPVSMLHLSRGVFDEAAVSLITTATVTDISVVAGLPSDVRRFRPNLVIESVNGVPFAEDAWVGHHLQFGDAPDAPALVITNLDERCAMVNLDPDTARATPELLRALVTTRGNRAGVYATVLRRGAVAVGQPVYLQPVREVERGRRMN